MGWLGFFIEKPNQQEKEMLPKLKTLLRYRHPAVIRSFIRNYPSEASRADGLFEDMLKYLWLSCKHTQDQKTFPHDESIQFLLVMHQEMKEIDDMWHNFILYTEDYTGFCLKYFGEYLHHQPDIADTIAQTQSQFTLEMEKYLSYVYDHLSEKTVKRWFASHL